MKIWWCNKCKTTVPKNTRQKREKTKGWVCPTCGVGLPVKPMDIIHEPETALQQLFNRPL